MTIDEALFRGLVQELIDDNPFAIRAVLKILGLSFTDTVPTLAVTCAERPLLKVNLGFLREHCTTEDHVKAVICHEFLHVLLRHTEEPRELTPARHLAFDAVINAIIHRQFGSAYSSMMARYYADVPGLLRLLRPMSDAERTHCNARRGRPMPQWVRAWEGLYEGRLVADDLEALAEDLSREASEPASGLLGAGRRIDPFRLDGGPIPEPDAGHLLGNHDELGGGDGELAEALGQAMREMNGGGIWRDPKSRGVGAHSYEALFTAADGPLWRWKRETLAVLRRHLVPDRHSRTRRDAPRDYRIPVLSVSDRRAFLRAQWSPYLPEAAWEGTQTLREGTAQVYLDVSGSMTAEMPLIVGLLAQFPRHIRRPFWAFSDRVVPATILNGQLRAVTSGGTSMACVIEHLARTRPAAAVVVTDGYIEPLGENLLQRAAATRLHALVTRDGHPAALARAGIPYTQLGKLPS
jgi:hypothetical protein